MGKIETLVLLASYVGVLYFCAWDQAQGLTQAKSTLYHGTASSLCCISFRTLFQRLRLWSGNSMNKINSGLGVCFSPGSSSSQYRAQIQSCVSFSDSSLERNDLCQVARQVTLCYRMSVCHPCPPALLAPGCGKTGFLHPPSYSALVYSEN